MTHADLLAAIDTADNAAAYTAATDKALFVQDLIEAHGVATAPGSALCDWIEDALEKTAATSTHYTQDGERMIRVRCSRTDHESAHHDFGMTDTKGRAVGCRVSKERVHYTIDASGNTIVPESKAGRSFYSVRIESTRDGKQFGALRHGKQFAQEHDAKMHATRGVKQARKRAEKTHGAPA